MKFTKWLISIAMIVGSSITFAYVPCDVTFTVDKQFSNEDIIVMVKWDDGWIDRVALYQVGDPLTSTWKVQVPSPADEGKHMMTAFIGEGIDNKAESLMPFKCSDNKLQLRFPRDFAR